MTDKLLKLRAEDAEDIQVISAVLQDAIVPVCDMVLQPESKSFVLVAQRLCREDAAKGPQRICSALTISGVTSAQMRGIDKSRPDVMLDLLAILVETPNQIDLVFAGNGRIRLEGANWKAALEDFGEAWPALCSPCHEEAVKEA